MNDNQFEALKNQINCLQKRIKYLESLLDKAHIQYETENCSIQDNCIITEEITKDHVRFFYRMFKGRMDVYSKRAGKPNAKTGKTGYYTQCWNFWKDGVCPKKNGAKVKCGDCPNQKYKQLTGTDLMNHLMGIKEDCSDVIGMYPMFPDESCRFLVFDFDNHEENSILDDGANTGTEWIEEVDTMRAICKQNGVDALVERSRSGKGAHIWIFFEEALPAYIARRFGDALLIKGAESVNQKTFKYYDRMIPAQDHLPAGGLGNLIALPLQGRALRKGNSAFVDEEWNAYPNQWQRLQKVKKVSKSFVEESIKEWTEIESSEEKPWDKKKTKFRKDDVEGMLEITLANQFFINVENIKPRMQNQLRRMAAFSNPEFYKKQAMGFAVRGIPRIISCSTDIDHYICLPRGCGEKLIGTLKESDITYNLDDKRQNGNAIDVSFKGKLYPEQIQAAEKMLANDIGVLHAATAFGKTAVGAYLVSERKVNTLVLVHNTEIMKNWVEDFEKFLDLNEEPPQYITPKGRVKHRKSAIGRLTSSHNSLTGILDVAMISSLGRKGDINDIVKDYGMVIMDECHHGASQTAEEVLGEVNARYVYGLTATPKRDDGLEQKIFMQFGPIRYRYTAKDRAAKQAIGHYVYPRFTRLVHSEGHKLNYNDAAKLVVENKMRNQQIIEDVLTCLDEGRTPLVITKSRNHAKYFYEELAGKVDHIFLLMGGGSPKEKDAIRENMRGVPPEQKVVLVATGQYIGEGFNYPRLDTMMLTMPISFQGNVEQYSGRLHRDYEAKKDVIIYDYVDAHIRVLERMYNKRLRVYKQMGYEICQGLNVEKQQANSIFDNNSYSAVFENDLRESQKEIIISSPKLNVYKIKRLINILKPVQESGVKVVVLTLETESHQKLIEELECTGVHVKLLSKMHEHYAIIDNEIVWYGSMNLLSRGSKEDNLMRVVSREIAQELMEMEFA